MAQKRSLKEASTEKRVGKNKAVSEEEPIVKEVKTRDAGKKRKTANRKRSLKDAAADQLVEKNKVIPEDPLAPIAVPVVEPAAAAQPTFMEAAAVEPPKDSTEKPLFDDASKAVESPAKGHPSLKWAVLLLLVGFAAGFFFGVGQAIGPANLAFILLGFAGGYLFGRFYKIF